MASVPASAAFWSTQAEAGLGFTTQVKSMTNIGAMQLSGPKPCPFAGWFISRTIHGLMPGDSQPGKAPSWGAQRHRIKEGSGDVQQ